MSADPRFAELHQALTDRYDLEELRTLCVHLGTSFDDLRGEGRSGKARELILWLQRSGRLDELEASIQETKWTRQKGGLTQALDNPYFHWGPIRDQEYFYGREEETRQVLQAANHGQCVSLVGLHKIGKTSLLLHLEALNHDGLSRKDVYVYVDGQAHRETKASVFYSEILRRIGEVLSAQDRSVRPVEEPKDEMDLMGLRQAIISLTRRRIRPVILIDEFDALCENQDFDLAFFGGLRSLVTTFGVVYVTASKRKLFQLNREKEILGSPFFNYFQTLPIGLFDDESTLRLIRKPSAKCGIHFDDHMVAEIFRLTGKHPFFLQRVCHIAFEMRRVQKGAPREQDLEQVCAKSRQELEDQMASYWEDLGSEEQRILLSVATDEALQQVSEVTLENLVRQCLLVKSNGNYHVFSALFKDYVCGQARPGLPRGHKWRDRFQDWEELGRGAMSIVYKAYQPTLDRYVAIKELIPQAGLLNEDTERFRREARSIAHLDHPNILPVYDFYPEVDRAYIVMKYAAAGSLADRLNKTKPPFDPAKAVQITVYIGHALACAHRQEVIHRDVKPANIFMGEDDWPLLGDFGLALTRGESPAKETGLTGSSDYVSPEQAVDARDADHRSDIYSLGVVLYHLLVGEVPYAEEAHPADRLMKRLTQGVPALRLRDSRISVTLKRIVRKATAAEPKDRYQTAEGMVEDLEAALESEGEPPGSDTLYRYDVFISYSHQDKEWVKGTLLPRLEEAGLRVHIDYRDFELGVPSLVNMENGVERSRKTLLVLTPNWVASEWGEFEALLIQTKDPAGRGRRILPLMVQPCELPARLQVFTYLDLTNPVEFDFQIQRLVTTIRSASQPPTLIGPTSPPRSVPPSRPVMRDFSHERGLDALGEHLTQVDPQIRLEFAVLESRLLENLQDERLYGINEAIRSERARIVQELNRLAIAYLNRSFNELCGT